MPDVFLDGVAYSDADSVPVALRSRAAAARGTNDTYLGQAALPGGTALTTTQLTTAIRILRAQVDALTRQNNALIRLILDQLDDTAGT